MRISLGAWPLDHSLSAAARTSGSPQLPDEDSERLGAVPLRHGGAKAQSCEE